MRYLQPFIIPIPATLQIAAGDKCSEPCPDGGRSGTTDCRSNGAYEVDE